MTINLSQLILDGTIGGLTNAWESFVFVIAHGGWVLFALLLARIAFYKRWLKKLIEYSSTIDYVFLNITVPTIPSESIMAAEQMFAQLHSTRVFLNWRERWMEGQYPPWLTLEIVSLGGVIRYLVRTPRSLAEPVKSAIFSQYPEAEINEVNDYLDALSIPYNPEEVDYDFWGTELKLNKPEAYPIKTYKDFEHQAPQVIIDPLSGLLEVMTNVDPEEMIAIQVNILGATDEWKEEAAKEVKKVKEPEEEKKKEGEEQQKKPMVMMSDAERTVINKMQDKLSKISFMCKFRVLYAAPEDKIRKGERVSAIFGGLSQFSSFSLNGFRPEGYSKTSYSVKYSESREKQKKNWTMLWQKRTFIQDFKGRELWQGGKLFHFSNEELATLFHFPLEASKRPSIEQTEAKKGEPPVNLPI